MILFLSATDHRHTFCCSWSRMIKEKSRKEICIACSKSVFLKNLFSICRSVILKERDTVNNTANLSTWRHLTNQSMIPESGIMERRNQWHVSRIRRPFPLPRIPLGSIRSPIFFLFDPVFWTRMSSSRNFSVSRELLKEKAPHALFSLRRHTNPSKLKTALACKIFDTMISTAKPDFKTWDGSQINFANGTWR